MPQLQDNIDNFVLQLDGISPHVRNYFDDPHRWIGRVTYSNMSFTQLLYRRPDLTLWDFVQWGNLMDKSIRPYLSC
ncbi:hypothetical protein TNCV_1285361 [Trichonephila clavipes]|uniref:Uncharacterized protein n=1 Tax=Trichonephila clavipes TaxID=2585209 RepID=A0A8X6SWZ1_TRICX|nr:hypothetical protein TNCV_1285361 [Trichonephila clavipes]